MRHHDPHARRRFRTAVGVSVGVHALVAAVVAALAAWTPSLPTPAPPDELGDAPPAFALGEPSEFPPATVTVVETSAANPASLVPDEQRAERSLHVTPGGRTAPFVPQPLTPEVSDLIRELGGRRVPASAAPPAPPRAEVIDVTDVKQVGHETSGESAPPAGLATGVRQHAAQPQALSLRGGGGEKLGKPLHAPLPADKCVVYVLDRSSSMRLTPDTFDAARAAVQASVEGTPDGGRFQVVVYNGSADVLLPGTRGNLLTADDGTRRKLADALADLAPEGRSTHREGLTAALGLKADYVILITDAGADELTDLKAVRKAATKPTAVYLVRAASGKVGRPEPLHE